MTRSKGKKSRVWFGRDTSWLASEFIRLMENNCSLLYVIVTNKSEHFRESGLYNTDISDLLCSCYVKKRVVQYKGKIIQVRSCYSFVEGRVKGEPRMASWYVREIEYIWSLNYTVEAHKIYLKHNVKRGLTSKYITDLFHARQLWEE